MLAPTIRLISTLLQREAAGFMWSHTEDTKMSPKFVFFLQTRNAENAAPALSLDTPHSRDLLSHGQDSRGHDERGRHRFFSKGSVVHH